jgi:hypothetical protein
MFSKLGYLGIWRDGHLRKGHSGNAPIKMAAAATAPTTPAFRLWSALSPTAPPIFPELVACVGSNGSSPAVTAFVAPAVGVAGSKIENGSPVDAIPVGVAVTEMSLSTNPNPAHASSKSTCDVSGAERVGKCANFTATVNISWCEPVVLRGECLEAVHASPKRIKVRLGAFAGSNALASLRYQTNEQRCSRDKGRRVRGKKQHIRREL